MKVALITGGTGFIGSHTAISMLKNEYRLVIVDSNINSSSKKIDNIIKILKLEGLEFSDRIKFVKGDIRDKKLLDEIFRSSISINEKIDCVIHFAGLKAVEESINEPLKYWDVNVNGTLTLLEVMKQYNCKKIIFSSSATLYGNKEIQSPIKEDSIIKPTNTYGKTKETIENILYSLSERTSHNWKIAILRYFNPIGAHSSGIIGEDPKMIPTNILPIINQVALGKKEMLEIYGNDWDTYDGTCIRDYIHVVDLAEGHLKALEYITNNDSKSQFLKLNLGTGKGVSVLELVNTFKKINKVEVPFKFASRREGDIPYSVADNSLAKKIIRWKPKYDLNQMCKDSWNWYSHNF